MIQQILTIFFKVKRVHLDEFSLYSGINAYIPEHFKSRFTEKIWLRNYSQ